MICNMCRSHLIDASHSAPVKVFVDLTQFPFAAIVHSLMATNPIVAVISLPFIALIYIFKKILGKPFNTPMFTGKDPKFHLLKLKLFKGLQQKSYHQAASFLNQHGFEPFVTLEDKSMVQAMFQDIWINKQQNLYATIHINKAVGKIIYTTFSAFTTDNAFISVDNTYAIPIRYPKNLIVQHIPKAPLDTIFQQLLNQLRRHNKASRLLALPALLSTGTKIRRFSIEQGIKQKLLYTKWKGQPGVTTCYHHPVNIAVRICSTCQMHVCESCYESYQEKYYCKNCFPQIGKAIQPSIPPATGPEAGFAGFGARVAAWLIDGVIISGIVAAIFVGLRYGITVLAGDAIYASLAFMLTQLMFMALVPFYFIAPIRHSGQTPGMRILGLRMMDQRGRNPDGGAALVRLAYFLFSCLFVFPFFGYLFVLFRKTKQGLHDQLAGTVVVTRHPVKKAIVSWSMLLVVMAVAGGYALQWASPWLNILRSFSTGAIASEVTLEERWLLPFDEDSQILYSFVGRGERIILTSATNGQAINIRSGDIIWTNGRLHNSTIQITSADETLPMLALQYSGSKFPLMLNFDSESGEIIWQRQLQTEAPALIFDKEIIVVYDMSRLWAYSTSNQLLWEKDLSEKFGIEYAVINGDILIVSESEEARKLTYLSRDSGNVLWEVTDPEYEPGYSLGRGYQFMIMLDGRSNLMFLPEQRLQWKSSQNVGYAVGGSGKAATNPTEETNLIFTTTSAVRSKDGKVLYAYPIGARFGCLSDSFLFLIHAQAAEKAAGSTVDPAAPTADLLVLDNHSGVTKKAFEGKHLFNLFKIAEDSTHIYMMANDYPNRQNAFRVASELLILDKKTLTLQEISVGNNITPHQIKILPDENLIFIPTFQHVGAYMIPDLN